VYLQLQVARGCRQVAVLINDRSIFSRVVADGARGLESQSAITFSGTIPGTLGMRVSVLYQTAETSDK
jgi:hypothetical protein